jgi:hypothetical protein
LLFTVSGNPFPRFAILKVFHVHQYRQLVPRLCVSPIAGN